MAVRQHWQLKLQAPYGAEPDGPPPDEPPPRSRLAGSEPRLPPPLVLEPGASSLADGKDARLPWTELERSALQQACTAAGWARYDPSDAAKRRDWAPDWKSIATAVGSRTPKQCRERWENYADPMIDPSPQAQQPQRGPASSGTKRPLPQQRREPKAQPEAAGSWQCADCGRGFDTSKGLSNHKRRCDGLSPSLRPNPSPAQKRVRFSRAHPDVAIGENGATVRYNAGGMDAYWQTAVCGGHVMRSGSGRHTAHFTVLQGGRTLNVGVAQDDFDPKGDTNASDGPQGWGFDSETGGYWHEGWLQRGLGEGATASLQELVDCGGVNLKESDTIQVRLPSPHHHRHHYRQTTLSISLDASLGSGQKTLTLACRYSAYA